MRRRIEIGLLYSREGSYALLSEACRQGALQAMADINANPDFDIDLIAVERDPKGNIDLYGPLCAEILSDTWARHVIGCVTSWSRKEVIPALERVGGTLWYAVPYEGFEASDHVVYTHACPNQHLLPLMHWTFGKFGKRGYLTGSNYIWGWEMNRVARSLITERGGDVLGERYLPINDTGVGRMIAEIKATRPDFVLNSLIGASSYAFLHAYAALGRQDSHFTAETCPVLSCNLTESELEPIGEAAEGLISAGPYFLGAKGWPHQGSRVFTSSFEASAYAAVDALANLLNKHPGAETMKLADLLKNQKKPRTLIDQETHHTTLPVLIAQVRNGAFEVLDSWDDIMADPYMTHPERCPIDKQPRLSVVK
ncbi:Possible regulatory protein similar to urea ABC transporter, substrate binding protein [hydrothermal vent metagenome]|uniref:Possible regulatory protein similar to urea ABC transporter, substrate binding protein n=1 Tax=hydrothermal vent metagenome TaxID=652676 RepID=A0A3B0TGW8_9ZZZZ